MDERQGEPISSEIILEQLKRVLASPLFSNVEQSRALLKYVVEQAVNQRQDRLKEYTVGAEALGRGVSFDPRTDSVVRAEASRLRTRLDRYYSAQGQTDHVQISLPKGSYVPQFTARLNQAEILLPPDAKLAIQAALPSRRLWIKMAALVTTVGAGAWLVFEKGRARDRPQVVVQFSIPLPPGVIFEAPIGRQAFSISPNGTRLAFTATDGSAARIWVRDLAALDFKPVTGSEGARTVFWSQDSRSLYYSVGRQFKQANLDTGSARSLARLPFAVICGSWRTSRDLILYLGPRLFFELDVQSGSLKELPGAQMRWAQFLDGTGRFIHVNFDRILGRYRAYASDYASQRSVPLMETDSRVQYAPPVRPGSPGHLLYIRGGSLLAQAYDAEQHRLISEPHALVQHLAYFSPSASGNFSVSDNGVLVYQSGPPLCEMLWYDRAGKLVGTAGMPAPFNGTVRISPNGLHLVAGIWSPENGGIDIWIFNVDGSEGRRVTFPPAVHPRAVWSPDGQHIAYASTQTGSPHLATSDLNEHNTEVPVMNESVAKTAAAHQIQLPTDWSGDGQFIAYDISLGEEEREVWLATVATGDVQPLLKNQSSQWGAVFSSDGKHIAFISDESGLAQVYIQAFEAVPTPHLVGEKHQVSKHGAWGVRWRSDGRELLYVGIDNWLYALAMAEHAPLGEPKALFRIPGTSQYGALSDFQFDATHDGQRFVMSTTGSVPSPAFTVIYNWQEKYRLG